MYYKWLWEDEWTLFRIPGFVWGDRETAEAKLAEFKEWTYCDKGPHLYVFHAAPAVPFPTSFNSRFCHRLDRPTLTQLTDEEAKQAWEYFQSKPGTWFDSADAPDEDVHLFLRLAMRSPPLKSAPNPVLDEYFCGHPVLMHRYD